MGGKIIIRQSAALIAVATLLVACSSGGGGGSTPVAEVTTTTTTAPPPPPPGPTADDFRTVEYERSWGLEAIGAAQAYANGYTGEGVTIGFVDFNFDLATTELNLHPASVGPDAPSVALYEAQTGSTASTDQHGHAVAVIAAGIKNDIDTHGVAYDARVLAVDFFSAVNSQDVTQDGVLYHVSNPWTYITDRGARVVNKSIGFDEGDVILNPPVVTEGYAIDSDAHVVAEGALLVSSAGNNSDPDPSLSNLNTIDTLRDNNILDTGPGAFIIVGAVNKINNIAAFSDRAGVAKNYYMVAPGVNVTFPWNGSLATGSGTSFSAPHVAGAAAIIFQRWPTLTAREVANILFDSATDLGTPGIDAIYGHGLLNVNAALQPLGIATFAVEGNGVAPQVNTSAMVLSNAFGDAAGFRSGLSNIMMLDGYERDFQIDLSSLIDTRSNRTHLQDVLDQRRYWRSSAVALSDSSNIFLALGEDQTRKALRPLLGQAQKDTDPKHDIILEFSGAIAGMHWSAGTGRSLNEALSTHQNTPAAHSMRSITQAFTPAVDTGSSDYIVTGLSLSPTSELKLGISTGENEGTTTHQVNTLREDKNTYAAALRFDRYGASSNFGIQLGTLIEDDAILGSRAAGGLSLNDQSHTAWITVAGEKTLLEHVVLTASVTAALTDPGRVGNSLLRSLESIKSTSFRLGLSTQELFRKDDTISLTAYQPLHVEKAPLTLVSGIARDRATGDVVFGYTPLSLVPSGREIAFEGAYRTRLGLWMAEANLAYRIDAGHVAGKQDASVLFSLSRQY